MVMAAQNDINSPWGEVFGEFMVIRFALVRQSDNYVRTRFAQTRGKI